MINRPSSRGLEIIRLQRISPKDVSIFFAITSLIAGTILMILAVIMFYANPNINMIKLQGAFSVQFRGTPNFPLLLAYPLINSMVGAILSALATALYNLMARFTGGIRISVNRN